MSFEIEPNNRFFQANRSIIEHEIKPAHTVTFVSEVDMSQIEAVRKSMGDRKPSYTAFMVKALARALKEFPYANRRVIRRWWLPFLGPRLQKFHHIDVAVAVERDIPGAEGVAFVDIIRKADERPIADVQRALKELSTCDETNNEQWRSFSGLIRKAPSWLAALLLRLPQWSGRLWEKYRGGAALISSPAKYGVDSVLTTWSWPLGLSFGLVKERPIAVNGEVVARKTCFVTMNFDRRVMAGAQGARFFAFLIEQLRDASTTLAEPEEPGAEPVPKSEAAAIGSRPERERSVA
ncbi:MAG: 2-oxo acid dehydrogenase subunit E2 [Phycisphaeraceae bacterium]